MSLTDTNVPETPTQFAATNDRNPVTSLPPFMTPVSDWKGYAAAAWAAWFNQVAKRMGNTVQMGPGAMLGIGGATPPLYPLDVRDGTSSQVHIASADQDDGTYITSYVSGGHPGSYLSSGAEFNGTNWVAKDTQASILGVDPAGNLVVFFNAGLTVGATFTPTQVYSINLANGKARLFSGGTAAFSIGAYAGPAYALDVRNTAAHFSDHDADDGGWLSEIHGTGLFLSHGAYYNGSQWIAKETIAITIALRVGATNGVFINMDAGLTVGASFTPTLIYSVNPLGQITIPNMPTTNPGAGTKILWADATDSYRVKYAF